MCACVRVRLKGNRITDVRQQRLTVPFWGLGLKILKSFDMYFIK